MSKLVLPGAVTATYPVCYWISSYFLRNYVIEINQKADAIQRTGKAAPVGYDQVQIINEVQYYIKHFKYTANNISQ